MASLHLLFLLPFLLCLQQVNIIFKIVMSYTNLDISKYRQDVEATCPPCPAPPVHACCGWMHSLYKLNFYLIFSYFYRSGDIMGTCCQVTLAFTSIFASICSQSGNNTFYSIDDTDVPEMILKYQNHWIIRIKILRLQLNAVPSPHQPPHLQSFGSSILLYQKQNLNINCNSPFQ